MRKTLTTLCICLLLASSLAAQARTGNITGKVVDEAGVALPGVTITVSGSKTAPMNSISSEEGTFRFLSLAPAADYSLHAEMPGFKTLTRGDIIINAGSNFEVTLTMEQGSIEEEVTVTAVNPVIDTKKSSTGAQVSQEMLQQLPSARDAFNVMKMAPSVVAAKEDVGGSEGGQAVGVTARGASSLARGDNSMILDGLPINWSQSSNATPFYFDFDTFEELSVTVGGADVTAQTAGVQTNMVTRRGGNTIQFSGRFYFTDSKFQMENMTDAFRKEGLLGTSKVNVIRDYGFNLSGPIITNKMWFYGSYGVQDIRTITIYNLPSETTLETLLAKVNLQLIPQNRLELFAQGNKKLMWGTATTASDVEGTDRLSLYPFGYPLIRFQDEHMFGESVFLSIKGGWYNSGYIQNKARDPENDSLAIWDVAQQREYGGGLRLSSDDPVYTGAAQLSFFKDAFLGANHEFKLGVEIGDRRAGMRTVTPGNLRLLRNFIDPVADFTGDGNKDIPPNQANFYQIRLDRGNYLTPSGVYTNRYVNSLGGYISDNFNFGRFNVALGLRYDYQTPGTNPIAIPAIDRSNPATSSLLTNRAIDLIDATMPGLEVPGLKGTDVDGNKYSWRVLSPRVNIAYDVTGDGKTVVKLSYATFGSFMSTDEGVRYQPGGASSFINFYWQDNGDHKADFNELYWHTVADRKYSLYRVYDDAGNFVGNWDDGADTFWSGFDHNDPGKVNLRGFEQVEKNAGSPLTTELFFSLEREIIPDLGGQLNLVYRKYGNKRLAFKWFPDTNTIIDSSYAVSAGMPVANIPGDGAPGDTGEAKNHEWYYINAAGTAYTPWTLVKKTDDKADYYGVDFALTKRFSKKWMLNSSVSLQWTSPSWGTTGFVNPTNRWAIDGVSDATPWTFKLGGVYALPYDITVSMNLSARAGWRIDRTVLYTDYRLPNPKSNSATLYLENKGSELLPAMINMGVRAEKLFRIMDKGKIYIMIDLFNAPNLAIAEIRQHKLYGNYYIYADAAQNKFVKNVNFYRLDKILNPAVARIGCRFQF